jgi:hypothetical protein
MSDKPATPPNLQVQIEIDESTAQGVYCNLAMMNHNPTEFIVDFIFVQPQQPKAKVRARIITSPQHMKRLLTAMQENVARYEKAFGPISVAHLPEIPIN